MSFAHPVLTWRRAFLLFPPLLLTACHKDAPEPDAIVSPTPPPMTRRPSPTIVLPAISLKPRKGEIVVAGTVTTSNPARKFFQMEVTTISLPPGQVIPLDAPRPKTVTLARTTIHADAGGMATGAHVEAVGKDMGKGKILPAREVTVGSGPASAINPPIPTPVGGYPAPAGTPGGYPAPAGAPGGYPAPAGGASPKIGNAD